MEEEEGVDFTSWYAGAPLRNEVISQYKCVNLPKTDDNNWTHENDANALSWYMVNDFFLASAL